MSGPDGGERIAVVGSGVAGLTAAWVLSRRHRVTIYEAEDRLGGHAHTHEVTDPDGNRLAIDTGFIVHNDTTYPLLRRLFGELGVRARRAEMSMSIRDEPSGIEYAGGRGLRGIFAQPSRVADPRLLSVLRQVRRFHRHARTYLTGSDPDDLTTYGQFLRTSGFSEGFVQLYAVPLVSCVWSKGRAAALEYPARYLFQFLDNHGMLSVSGSPQWFTVVGGSRTYVDAIAARVDTVTGRPIVSIVRGGDGVSLTDTAGRTAHHDRVVIATHADQALGMLADPTPAEKELLGVFTTTASEAVLHTDARLLPRARHARASWNYVTSSTDGPPVVTYWMNRLQRLQTRQPYLVTLNATHRIDPDRVIATMRYRHPVYDRDTIVAQSRLATLTTGRTAFAGAWQGWGFHEDGCRSGVAAARAFGVDW